VIRTVLNDEVGWGATVVHDADGARQVLRHVKIEALVLDANLPGISGIDLLDLLRQDPHWNEPTTILMSADASLASMGEAACDGVITAFLRKPFAPHQLVEKIKAAS
jgi:DNA-binding response OmpR family regulator